VESEKKRLEDVIPNEYEAVLLAAKLARKINALRSAAKEQLPPEEYNKMDQRKVTSLALEELASGKVRFERKTRIEEEETFDLT
jgi:DNA-directed RNA polymerase omega subunit